MSETIVTIVGLEGSGRLDNEKRLIGPFEIVLQIVKSDMTREEAEKAFHDNRYFKLVEVFDQEEISDEFFDRGPP